MSYQVLARKWRPRRFQDVVGQEIAVRALGNALERGQLHPALLFSGTRGVGKTTLARIVAKALNCERGAGSEPCCECSSCREIDEGRFVDLIEVDAASRTKVDDTRELLDNVQYAPARGRCKVYLIDEVHMLSNHSFNALLKTLEEPPEHVRFLLATTDPRKLPVTILSRCLQFHLGHLPVSRIQEHTAWILEQESVEFEPEALRLIAGSADGSLRDALSLLDQAIAYAGGRLTKSSVEEMLGTIPSKDIHDLLSALAGGDVETLLVQSREMAGKAPDFHAVLDALASALQRLAVIHATSGSGEDADEAELALAGNLTAEEIQLHYQMAIMGRRDLQWAPDPATGFEMTLLRMAAFRPELEEQGASKAAPSSIPVRNASAASRQNGQSKETPPAAAKSPEAVGDAPFAAAGDEWSVLLRKLGLQGMTGQLARHCLLRSHGDGQIILQLQPEYRQLLTDQAKSRLEGALRKHFGAELKLRVEVGEAGDGETPAQADTRRNDERYRKAEQAIERDPTVDAFRSQLGASIKPDSIHPVDEPPQSEGQQP